MSSLSHQLFHASAVGAWLRLMRFDRPIGTLLLLWPTLWALWFAADGMPNPGVLGIFVLGVIVMRAAGCVINDYADRNIDPYVERTAGRPLARGEIEPRQALMLFAALLTIAFGLVCFTNGLTVLLALPGAFLAATYPFLKRYTYLPQFYLGAAFAWSVPMAYAAQAGTVDGMTALLFSATVLWTAAYDTFYAMVDREDDVKIGVRSTAILFGELDRMAIAVAQLCFIGALVLAGLRAEYGLSYLTGVAVAGGLCGWQQWLARKRDRDAAFRAFLNNNWVGLAVFLGLVIETWPTPEAVALAWP